MGKVYTFGPTFRAENSNTSRHLAEFWMVEPEMAFYELADNMDLAEAFLKRIFSDVLQQCPEDMAFFNERIDNTTLETLEAIAGSQFVRLPYTEAIQVLERSGEPFEFPIAWGVDLQAEHERFLTEKHFKKPVILYDYPRAIKPFYMRLNDDEKTVRAMDVLVPKVGEITAAATQERIDELELRDGPNRISRPRLLLVSRSAALRHRAPRGLRPGPGAGRPVHHRMGINRA